MAIENACEGLKIALNTTEFLFTNIPINLLFKNYEDKEVCIAINSTTPYYNKFIYPSDINSLKNILLDPSLKYIKNSILGIKNFNLLSLNWNRGIIALGGICKNNINKLKSTGSIGCGFKSLINEV